MGVEKKKGKLDWIDPKKIIQSEVNPRKQDFYKDKDFLRLKESVIIHGVLVPIIIKNIAGKEEKPKYQLVDGERRWKAALETNQPRIQVYILPADQKLDILTTMFQIHMNQKGWNAIEQAKALEDIVNSLKEKYSKTSLSDKESEKLLIKDLKEKTGMDEATAKSRLRFFRWPEDIRNIVYDDTSNDYYSYVVEIESRIVEPLMRNYPEIEEIMTPNQIREALFEKVTSGYVRRAERIRDANIITKKRSRKDEKKKAKGLILKFIENTSFTISEVHEQYLYLFPEDVQKPPISYSSLVNNIRSLTRALEGYNENYIAKLKSQQISDLNEAIKELIIVMKNIMKILRNE